MNSADGPLSGRSCGFMRNTFRIGCAGLKMTTTPTFHSVLNKPSETGGESWGGAAFGRAKMGGISPPFCPNGGENLDYRAFGPKNGGDSWGGAAFGRSEMGGISPPFPPIWRGLYNTGTSADLTRLLFLPTPRVVITQM